MLHNNEKIENARKRTKGVETRAPHCKNCLSFTNNNMLLCYDDEINADAGFCLLKNANVYGNYCACEEYETDLL